MPFSKKDVERALEDLGVGYGDVIFSHMALWPFGRPQGCSTVLDIFYTFYEAIFNVIGEKGLLIVPTFTYSFCKGEIFDVENSSSNMGIFPETLRKMDGSLRTFDPIFSVCLHGNIGKIFPSGNYIISTECFGEGSIWDLMLKANAKICNFGLDSASTFIHYVEKRLEVPYRYDKTFWGYSIFNKVKILHSVIYFVRDLKFEPDFVKFHNIALERKYAQMQKVGRGIISLITCKDTFNVVKEVVEEDTYGLVKRVE